VTTRWSAAAVSIALLVLAWSGSVRGQASPRLAEVELGFRGVPVADAWNPLRVTLRDVGAGQLTLAIDIGSLREGQVPWAQVLPVSGGAGVRTIETDVYLPAWRTLVWTLEAGGTLVASGTLPRDAVDRRPVDLVVSARPGEIAERLGGRVVDVAAAGLPTRAAAYDGVRSIWVDGSTAVPSPAALSAAAAAGAVVVGFDAARGDPALAAVWPDNGWRGIGAGGWWTGDAPTAAELERARVDLHAWAAAFAGAEAVLAPVGPPAARVLVLASLYVLLVVASWRVGGAPGLATWCVVVAGATALAWTSWRPPAATVTAARSLHVATGDLALRQRVHDVLTLPAGEIGLPLVARPAAAVAGRATFGPRPATTLTLGRWRSATLLEPPQATAALLGWDPAGLPRALGDRPLTDVRVVGGPAWSRLDPGLPLGEPTDPAPLFGAAAAFEALLPRGTVWARAGRDWHVALPHGVRW
jgi:hypothetical protein